MAYDPEVPPSLVTQAVGGPVGLRWFALMWVDPIADVLEAGYISNAADLGMREGDGLLYKDTNRGEWDQYALLVQTIAADGSATLAFPEIPAEAYPEYTDPLTPEDEAVVIIMIDGRQYRVPIEEAASAILTGNGLAAMTFTPSPVGSGSLTILSALERWQDPRSFITMDGTTDDAADLNAWFTALMNEDIPIARIPHGIIAIGDEAIAPPSGLTFIGDGAGPRALVGTQFLCLSADSKLAFGGRDSANASFGGPIGGFWIDANNLALQPLYFGRLLERVISDINISNGPINSEAVLIEEMQNCHIGSLNINYATPRAGSTGIILDRGCGGILFSRTEVSGLAMSLEIRETSGGVDVPYPEPTHITFDHPVFERSPDATCVLQTDGTDIVFNTPVFAVDDIGTDSVLVDITSGIRTTFYRGTFIGVGQVLGVDHTIGLRLASGASAIFDNTQRMVGLLNGISIAVGASLDYENIEYSVTGTLFSGAGAQDTVARKRFLGPLEVTRRTSTDNVMQSYVDGDVQPRYRQNAGGTLSWGTGALATDTSIFRSAAGRLTTQQLATTAGFIVPLLTAAPTAVEGLVVRADGVGWDPLALGVEHTVIRSGGVWKRLDV